MQVSELLGRLHSQTILKTFIMTATHFLVQIVISYVVSFALKLKLNKESAVLKVSCFRDSGCYIISGLELRKKHFVKKLDNNAPCRERHTSMMVMWS